MMLFFFIKHLPGIVAWHYQWGIYTNCAFDMEFKLGFCLQEAKDLLCLQTSPMLSPELFPYNDFLEK